MGGSSTAFLKAPAFPSLGLTTGPAGGAGERDRASAGNILERRDDRIFILMVLLTPGYDLDRGCGRASLLVTLSDGRVSVRAVRATTLFHTVPLGGGTAGRRGIVRLPVARPLFQRGGPDWLIAYLSQNQAMTGALTYSGVRFGWERYGG